MAYARVLFHISNQNVNQMSIEQNYDLDIVHQSIKLVKNVISREFGALILKCPYAYLYSALSFWLFGSFMNIVLLFLSS